MNEKNKITKSVSQNELDKAVESAFEKRISLENLFSQKFSEIKNQYSKEIESKYKEVKIYGGVGLIILALLGVIGYSQILSKASKFITQQIDKKLIDPELNKAVENLVTANIKPLKESVTQIKSDIQGKQSQLEAAQSQLTQMIEIQQLSSGARAGSRADYEKLLMMSKSEEENIQNSAEIAVRNLKYYFSADRTALSYQILVDGKNFKRIHFSVEELAEKLGSQEDIIREATVNVIAKIQKKYYVGRLVKMLIEEPKETNLRVCARITRALNIITDERFDPLDFNAIALWWEKYHDEEEYAWPFHHYFDGVTAFNVGSLEEALIHFDRMIEREPEALSSLIFKARILTEQGKYEEAETTFKQVEDKNKDYRWLHVWRAFFFLKKGKHDAAISGINRALEISPGVEEFISTQNLSKPLLSEQAVKLSN